VNEKELATALAKNLDGSFERLVRIYQNPLYSFALRLSHNTHDAEDIAQEAFVRAYQALKSYSRDRIEVMILKPWLYKITLNVFRNRLRGRHLQLVSLNKTDDDSPVEPQDDESQRPESIFETTESRNQLDALVTRLPEKYRVAVILRYVEGLDYAKLAAVLGQPIGTVKSNVHRGIQLLRKSVSKQMREVKS
jgi:RNA polymerase sigma-70 factor (ECF subfamily)